MQRTYSVGPQIATRYTRESVERGLTHHLGQGGQEGWIPDGRGGYKITTGIGIIQLRTLRDAALFVIGMAEGKRRLEREAVA